jgi:hypothetical protein
LPINDDAKAYHLDTATLKQSHAIFANSQSKRVTGEVKRQMLVLDGEMSRKGRQQALVLRRTADLFDGISDGISDFQKQKTIRPCGFSQFIQVHLSFGNPRTS